ncbi:MAG TPA: hypothetical protein VII98_00125 [Solirubrobacteraceae bacterium]
MKAALSVLVSLLVVLVLGTTAAMATPPPVAAPATQAAGQSSGNDQSATAGATSTQSSPSNINIPVRVLSPGNDGSVDQSNSSTALAGAVNLNATQQQVGQTQAGGGSGPATQAAGQDNTSHQTADSTASSTQDSPSNVNIPVRVLSPGNDGSVSQSNDSTAGSLAANVNATDQSTGQSQAGSGGLAEQVAGQKNGSSQSADSTATSTQDHAVNYNIPVRVLSPGDGGSVDQSNSSTAVALGVNANLTGQKIDQNQAGGGGSYGGVPYVQAAGQQSASTQDATSDATSTQCDPTNSNIPVRVLSPGNDGSVTQSNDSMALSLAANLNKTDQSIGQHQAGPTSAVAALVQAAGQDASSKQDADATATSTQSDPSNTNAPVRVLSSGDGGSVDQSNSSFAGALALNANLLCQSIWQNQGPVLVRP